MLRSEPARVDSGCDRVTRFVHARGAHVGNFLVTKISEDETWVVVAEWMRTKEPDQSDFTVCKRYGSDNSIFVARILFDRP